MTTKDDAGDKLVASIRKTKTAVKSSTKASGKKSVKKTAQSGSKKVNPVKTAPTSTSQKKQLVDLFQSGRRVWPD